MTYPIFDSIIKNIEKEIARKAVKPTKFRVWKDSTIHAIGLELALNIEGHTSGIKEVTINFDWDSFREAKLARQLEGMKKHPLLSRKQLLESRLSPTLDIETAWHFDEQQIINLSLNGNADARIDYASSWMNALNQEIARITNGERTINRWHIEIEGDRHGKYVSSMCLLTYQQYSLEDIKHLNDVHTSVNQKLQQILNRSLRILELAGRTRPAAA